MGQFTDTDSKMIELILQSHQSKDHHVDRIKLSLLFCLPLLESLPRPPLKGLRMKRPRHLAPQFLCSKLLRRQLLRGRRTKVEASEKNKSTNQVAEESQKVAESHQPADTNVVAEEPAGGSLKSTEPSSQQTDTSEGERSRRKKNPIVIEEGEEEEEEEEEEEDEVIAEIDRAFNFWAIPGEGSSKKQAPTTFMYTNEHQAEPIIMDKEELRFQAKEMKRLEKENEGYQRAVLQAEQEEAAALKKTKKVIDDPSSLQAK